jgi:cell division septation protein DedD
MSSDKPVKKRRFRYQIDMGPLSMMLWGIGIFFFIAWIFVLGIFVGRGFLPGKISNLSDLNGEIYNLSETIDVNKTNETKQPIPSSTLETEPELAFYDKLTTKKDEAKINIQPEAVTETQKTTVPPRETIAVQASSSDKKIDPAPAPVVSTPKPPTPTGAGQYTIQVASIAEIATAQKTVKQLVQKGFDAYYYETKVKGKTYYRVRCGKFSNRADAVKSSLKLQEKTGLKGYVTGTE